MNIDRILDDINRSSGYKLTEKQLEDMRKKIIRENNKYLPLDFPSTKPMKAGV